MIKLTTLPALLGDSPQVKILSVFIDNYPTDFSRTAVSKISGVRYDFLDKIFYKLLELGVIEKSRVVGRATFYKLNGRSNILKKLVQLNYLISDKINDNKKWNHGK